MSIGNPEETFIKFHSCRIFIYKNAPKFVASITRNTVPDNFPPNCITLYILMGKCCCGVYKCVMSVDRSLTVTPVDAGASTRQV